jgi:hypothetical protein
MRSFIRVSGGVCLFVFAFVGPLMGASQMHFVVDDDKVECPNAGFTHIQDAVNAASPGATIRVCKGTYVEQVSINKPLEIQADSGAILMPAAMQANASSFFDAAPLATAILVSDANDVTIRGLVVDGANADITACSPILFGVIYQNSSGSIERVTVRNFRLVNLPGCQSGTGIFVQSGGGQTSQVSIMRSTIHDFQKNGITANEIGTQATINENVVTGIGPTAGAAQNGIQIGFGAGGSITGNTVTNNVWSPCTTASTCQAAATNILVTQSDGVTVSGNTAGISNVAIFIDGNQATVEGNETFLSLVFDGIRLAGNQALARSNQVFNASESGIFVGGNNNVVERNTITEAAIGILKVTGATGNLIRANRVFGAPVTVQDPAEAKLAGMISPLR